MNSTNLGFSVLDGRSLLLIRLKEKENYLCLVVSIFLSFMIQLIKPNYLIFIRNWTKWREREKREKVRHKICRKNRGKKNTYFYDGSLGYLSGMVYRRSVCYWGDLIGWLDVRARTDRRSPIDDVNFPFEIRSAFSSHLAPRRVAPRTQRGYFRFSFRRFFAISREFPQRWVNVVRLLTSPKRKLSRRYFGGRGERNEKLER